MTDLTFFVAGAQPVAVADYVRGHPSAFRRVELAPRAGVSIQFPSQFLIRPELAQKLAHRVLPVPL